MNKIGIGVFWKSVIWKRHNFELKLSGKDTRYLESELSGKIIIILIDNCFGEGA